MVCEYDVADAQQDAGERSPDQIGLRDGEYLVDEILRRIGEQQALDEAADGEREDHEEYAIGGGPEMEADEVGGTPLATAEARHDVVHATEHHHREECVEPEVRVADGIMREVRYL